MSTVRVARIITRLNIGGPSLQAMLLTQRLDPGRYESLLVAGTPAALEGDMTALRPLEGVVPRIVPELGRSISPARDLAALYRLVRILRGFRPHLVHTHMAKAGSLGRVAARLAGVPVVVHTFHGNVLRGYFGTVPSRAFLQVERALAAMSTRVIAISARQAREIVDLGIARPERIEVVPLGLDLAPFAAAPRGRFRAELGIPPGAPLAGIVARLVPIKAVDVFLEAAARVRAERPEATFVIVGDGELRDGLVARAQALGLAGAVRFVGWRADLPAIYADLDVLALTSRNEGTPVSIIEALAAGTAVVATAVGGVPDLIEHGSTGLLARDGDPSGIARAIGELLGDPERRRALGRAGRDAVHPKHDSATLIGAIDRLYTSLVGRVGDRGIP
ncbi:MAG: glycosyltransferase family 4 protein [Chloroflexi bacterium]|nr:glycosyltransferase family 4 protein [Chloroflexota bacterium]